MAEDKHGADISVMQESNLSFNDEGFELSRQSRDLQETRSDTGEKDTGEDDL